MEHWFQVQHLDIERLLLQWRWLCRGPEKLIARGAFGDLFLADESGHIWWLDVAVAKLTNIAASEVEFRDLLDHRPNRDQWFAETDEQTAAEKGLVPNHTQCIGFEIPLVFEESGASKPYLIDIYEHVSFLGDLNRQIAEVSDGGKVNLIVGQKPD